ncbi:MAG: energy-coupling factor ABC transporter ATP-binding protein [Acidaminococcales bacterium]|jgi:cobalt/nickel transport system ATP-binding protein|nr:energy-coupling factor ABC transporter ATP-binding protein [Acidaminococcales bacterium]
MSEELIRFINVKFSYPCGRQALSGIYCSIKKGEGIGLVGANGAGKTSFLSLLAGLYLPQAGRLSVCGLEASPENLKQIRQKVGFVFQNPDNQLFMLTVFDDVAFGPLNKGLSDSAAAHAANAALKAVGAAKIGARAPYQLSGGEKRLAALASVLSMQPEILALDEPDAGLDSYSRRRLINTLNNITATKIIATHDLNLVMDTCGKIILLSDGAILAQGAPQDIFRDAGLLAAARIEPPAGL